MKYLMICISLLVGDMALAQNPTCDELDTDSVQSLYVQANNYFFDHIAVSKIAEVATQTFDLDLDDCHDYDGEFDRMEFMLQWRQSVEESGKKVYQTCTQEIAITYFDEVDTASYEVAKCVSDKINP